VKAGAEFIQRKLPTVAGHFPAYCGSAWLGFLPLGLCSLFCVGGLWDGCIRMDVDDDDSGGSSGGGGSRSIYSNLIPNRYM
jgi:hypothetical protein